MAQEILVLSQKTGPAIIRTLLGQLKLRPFFYCTDNVQTIYSSKKGSKTAEKLSPASKMLVKTMLGQGTIKAVTL